MRIALLISGSGTTVEAIIRACGSGALEGVIPVCVIASKVGIPGIERAEKAGIAPQNIIVLKPADFSSREAFGEAIIAECKKRDVDFVGQYGWLPLTPPNVIAAYEGMIVNQHPAPLDPGRPDFGGKGMWGRRAVCARLLFVRRVQRDFWTEATAHRVTAEYDMGAVVKATKVPILSEDDVASLYARLYPVEYETQIATLRDFVNGTVKEIVRDEPLVRPGEEGILEECKKEAMELYPHG